LYMDQYLVTATQWDDVCNWAITNGYSFDNAGSFKATNHPIQTVNWYDCVKWCNARSEKEDRPVCYFVGGNIYRGGDIDAVTCFTNAAGYRLPTDVEWVYAARGGLSGRRFPWGNTIDHTEANYCGDPTSSGGDSYDLGYAGYDTRFSIGNMPYTSPVNTFASNGYGLNDMVGNAWEWCWDWCPGYVGADRVLRGGRWGSYGRSCRTANRYYKHPDFADDGVGFRTVLSTGQ